MTARLPLRRRQPALAVLTAAAVARAPGIGSGRRRGRRARRRLPARRRDGPDLDQDLEQGLDVPALDDLAVLGLPHLDRLEVDRFARGGDPEEGTGVGAVEVDPVGDPLAL